MNPTTELSYEEALACYFDVYGEDAAIPSATDSERHGGGWLLANVNGFMAFVADDGEVSEDDPTRVSGYEALHRIEIAWGTYDPDAHEIRWTGEWGQAADLSELADLQIFHPERGDEIHIVAVLEKQTQA